jgi:hypothetical protein
MMMLMNDYTKHFQGDRGRMNEMEGEEKTVW